jgi:putative membrane protein
MPAHALRTPPRIADAVASFTRWRTARRVRICLPAIMAIVGLPAEAFAHETSGVPSLATAWSPSPWLLLPLACTVALYLVGLLRLWRQAGVARGVSRAEAGAFFVGIVALCLAMLWPLDALGEWSLAAHMAQHMLLLAVVPPLLLAGRPAAVMAHALTRGWTQRLHAFATPPWLRLSTALGAATLLHSAVMWAWHLPVATAAALASDAVHWAMHASFLLAGLWFWAAVWRCLRDPDTGAGGGALALLAVMMQMGLLGGLLTFAPRPLYADYVQRAPAIGLDVMADQQLAGLLMWVPSGLPYLAGGLWLLYRGLARLERPAPAVPAPRNDTP